MPAETTEIDTSRSAFLKNLSACGLATTAQLIQAAEKVPETVAHDGLELATQMVKEDLLTLFQVTAILDRRFDDLRMGNYEILDKLGAGGMGTVFKARHRRMNRLVALKVLSKEVVGTASFAQRFQREVETIARLAHPNIVMAYDADEGPAGPFLVMEFVNGRDLASDVHKGGPLSVDDAVDCILQSARGLEYAHGQGIVHRDIKPGNLIRDVSGVLKVADLGLARFSDGGQSGGTSLTAAGNVVGTVDYMPPEQAIDSSTIDHRADIYSLGCTLYLLLAGKPPYSGSSLMAVLLAHRDKPIPSLQATRPDVPPELEAIFRHMVEKQREARFDTMTDVVVALEKLKQTTPLSKERPSAAKADPLDTAEFSLAELKPGRDTSKANLAANAEQTLVSGVSGMKVVLAEPSRAQSGIIRRYLEQLGVVVVHATGSGKDARAAVVQHQANAVFSAMHLSDMTAVELVSAMNVDAACNGVGFVLATSESESEMTSELPARDSLVILHKPFDVKKVCLALEATRKVR